MTTTELKELLESAAGSMETLNDMLPPETADQILSVLHTIDKDKVDLLLPLIQIANPTLTKEKLVKGIENSQKMVESLKMMVVNKTTDRVASICRKLENRSLVLAIVAKML